MRTTTFRSRIALAFAVGATFGAPTVVSAQQPTAQPATQPQEGRTHVVRPGDTLWDLALVYYGDPFLWPEIYRLNTNVVEDPHWIYPGEVLAIGEGMGPVASDEVPSGGGTVFGRRGSNRAVSAGIATIERAPRPTIRPGEYFAAPFVDRRGGPADAGRILRIADLPGVNSATDRDRLQLNDDIYINAPGSGSAVPGERYLAFARLGDVGSGQLMVPTGIVEVTGAAPGEAPRARIVQEFDQVRIDQGLIPLDTLYLSEGSRPAPVEFGLRSRVLYVINSPVLPSIQHYVVLDASVRDGVQIGDQFTLVRERGQQPRPKMGLISNPFRRNERQPTGPVVPEERIAVVQVVRVTPFGTTGIIIDQTEPAIRAGVAARLTAKMP